MYIASQQSLISSLDSFHAIQLDTVLGVLFVYLFYCFFSRVYKSQRFPQNNSYPSLLLGQSVDGCVTLWALFDNKLAFFLSFKTTPDYFKCIPPGTKRIWFSLHCTWVFLSPVVKETERAAHPILVIPASGLGGSLLAGQQCFCIWLPQQNHLHSLFRSCLTGWHVLGFPI